MICREQDEAIVMIKQHDHGLLAGELAIWFKVQHTSEEERHNEVLWAVAQHDRGWIDLDETPFWNDAEKAPYTFIDFPVVPKLTFYKRGLDEIEAHTPYGALLCSLHFERLIKISGIDYPELKIYQEHEEQRRASIHRALEASTPIGEDELYYDARLLEICDDLSLYMGLNEPGSPKSAEHPWWREGFSGSEDFNFTDGRRIAAEWDGTSTLILDPFPFTKTLEVAFKQKRVHKSDIAKKGIATAYSDTPEEECRIVLAPRTDN